MLPIKEVQVEPIGGVNTVRSVSNAFVEGMVPLLDLGARVISLGTYVSAQGTKVLGKAMRTQPPPEGKLERAAREAGSWTAAALNFTVAAPLAYLAFDLIANYGRR